MRAPPPARVLSGSSTASPPSPDCGPSSPCTWGSSGRGGSCWCASRCAWGQRTFSTHSPHSQRQHVSPLRRTQLLPHPHQRPRLQSGLCRPEGTMTAKAMYALSVLSAARTAAARTLGRGRSGYYPLHFTLLQTPEGYDWGFRIEHRGRR